MRLQHFMHATNGAELVVPTCDLTEEWPSRHLVSTNMIHGTSPTKPHLLYTEVRRSWTH
jgi:hypothetical protein